MIHTMMDTSTPALTALPFFLFHRRMNPAPAPLRVKICCISSPEEARMAARAGADLLGLVGPMPGGPGVLTPDEARAIVPAVPPPARAILLTSSETAAGIVAGAAHAGVTAVQVVRHIPAEEASALAASGLHYVQVIHVEDAGALDLIDVYAPHANAFLLDSGRPASGELGGTGRVHDWTVSADFRRRAPLPVFLAGGLTPDTIADAVARVRPAGVDICSGLRRDGKLDPGLLAAFMAALGKDAGADA